MPLTIVYTSPTKVVDLVQIGDTLVAALGDNGLSVLNGRDEESRLDLPCTHLVLSDDQRQLLAVDRRTKRVHRVSTATWLSRPLGVTDIDEWTDTFDGQCWATYSRALGLRVLTPDRESLIEVSRLQSDQPDCIERTQGGVWIEVSTVVSCEFQEFTLPGLDLIAEGGLRHPPGTRCPPEVLWTHSYSPLLAQPVFAVHSFDLLVTATAPAGDARVITLDGRTIASLPSPPVGLVAQRDLAVVWARRHTSIELVLCFLPESKCLERVVLEGATETCVRMQEGLILVWDDRGRIFRWVYE